MPFKKGNQFWKARSSHGRKPIFADADQLWEACVEYFEWVDANPLHQETLITYKGTYKRVNVPKMRAMTIEGLCIFLDIATRTWFDWRENDGFSHVVTRVEEIIRSQKFAGAAADLLNANIIARDLGLADKRELGGEGGGPIKVTLADFYGEATDTEPGA